MTLTHVLQIQDQLWASLSNPSVAMRELAGETTPVPPPRRAQKGVAWGSTEMGDNLLLPFGRWWKWEGLKLRGSDLTLSFGFLRGSCGR